MPGQNAAALGNHVVILAATDDTAVDNAGFPAIVVGLGGFALGINHKLVCTAETVKMRNRKCFHNVHLSLLFIGLLYHILHKSQHLARILFGGRSCIFR